MVSFGAASWLLTPPRGSSRLQHGVVLAPVLTIKGFGISQNLPFASPAPRSARKCKYMGVTSDTEEQSTTYQPPKACNRTGALPSNKIFERCAVGEFQDVVIVGAGIAGVGTALALHRLGVKSLVIEQFDSLRISGTTIGIWENAWRALDVLGVADDLRAEFIKLHGVEFYLADGSCIKSIPFKVGSKEIELRGVERKALLAALAEPLPVGTMRFNARVVGIHKNSQTGCPMAELEDGSTIHTKVLIGCDGIRSVVGKCMGFREPRFVGYYGIRGVGRFPDGHNFKPVTRQILGRGVRAGLVPMDRNRIYWFIAFNGPLGPKIPEPELIRTEALNLVHGWPKEIVEIIQNSPPETLTRSALMDRWLWPFVGPKLYNDGVTLAGDALHPMTPNLGQGGCCALEDAVILGRELSASIRSITVAEDLKFQKSTNMDGHLLTMEKINHALRAYSKKRWSRMFPLTIKSFLIGALLQWDSQLICKLRDNILPEILRPEIFLSHTFYDCGELSEK